MSVRENLGLLYHFLAELGVQSYEAGRIPEPEVMVDTEGVRQYRDAVQAEGNGASAHLFNLLCLSAAIRPGDTVLDLACGPAALLIELAKLRPDARFIGVDLSGEMLTWAKVHLQSEGLSNVQFLQEDICQLPSIADQSISLVMSTLSLHHLPDEEFLARCFQRIANVVRPDGNLYLLDFSSLKRAASVEYFVRERAKNLEAYLAADYEASMKAAFRKSVFGDLLPLLQSAVPTTTLHSTFGVPFFILLTSLDVRRVNPEDMRALEGYWHRMGARQKKDFKDLRMFFALNGLKVADPERLAGAA